MKKASLGTVVSGTLKAEDLLFEFLHELKWQSQMNGAFLSRPENFALRDRFDSLVGDAQDCFGDDGETIRDEKQEKADDLIEEIQDCLSEHFAPSFCYFGPHSGNGADFGFWPCMELIDELPTVEDGELEVDDCKQVNDHGNVTVFSGGKIVLELV